MVLAVDIGNTTIGLAGMAKGRVIWMDRFLTAGSRQDRAVVLERIRRRWKSGDGPSAIVVCSVVPKKTDILVRELKKIFQLNPLIVGQTIKVPLHNCYARPDQVGQDRLVVAYAAKEFYGAPVIVIDLGTAITFDVVSAGGDYEGGMIIPGIQMSTESLFVRTALLPSVKAVKPPKNLIGKTTRESILSGIFFGYGSLCSGLIERIQNEMKVSAPVVLTGGHAKQLQPYILRPIAEIHPHLVFEGLALLLDY